MLLQASQGLCCAQIAASSLGKTKINVDAAVSKNSGTSSVAAVARDSTSLFMGAFLVVLTDISDSETLEVLTCRKGLALGKDLLLHNLVLESDCANVVRSIKDEAMGPYGQIVREIKTTV